MPPGPGHAPESPPMWGVCDSRGSTPKELPEPPWPELWWPGEASSHDPLGKELELPGEFPNQMPPVARPPRELAVSRPPELLSGGEPDEVPSEGEEPRRPGAPYRTWNS